MIKVLDKYNSEPVLELLKKDYGINYFIRLGLAQENTPFKKGWLQSNPDPEVILLQRKSGNLHIFALADAELKEIVEIIKSLQYRKIMGELSLIKKLHYFFTNCELTENSYIASLELNIRCQTELSGIEPLKPAHLAEVVELYETLFRGFPKLEYLEEKLASKRGRGFTLKNDNDKIISIVQTDFEEDKKATLTGVGTALPFQQKGWAYKMMQQAHYELYKAGIRKLYLQYDDDKAGKLYDKLGYKIEARIGNLIHKKAD